MKQFNPILRLREKIFKWLFRTGDKFRSFYSWFSNLCRILFTIALILIVLGFIFYIGFERSADITNGLRSAFRILFLILFLTKYLPELFYHKMKKKISSVFRMIVFLFSLGVFLSNFNFVDFQKPVWNFLNGTAPLLTAVFFIVISEISSVFGFINSTRIPPALIFSFSFLIIIVIGSGLLMLPNAHSGTLSYLDSLFTSVSAVCVTGLTVVNTATAFTPLGKIIIVCLIQIGGLGIMTFTGFFSYIFTASSSLRDRLLLKELFSAESLNNLFRILTKIVVLTFLLEFIGAAAIYNSLEVTSQNRALFSLFHSVSAFCNAGFSTLPDGLLNEGIRQNNTLHISIAFLIILGGIGFPVLLSLYTYLKNVVIYLIRKLQGRRTPVMQGRISVSIRLALWITFILITAGSLLYYFFESGNTMKDNDGLQRIIISFFGSVSARTAGFNIAGISRWGYATIFMMIFIMWIGASPGSTGGGIKTTTFAIALLSTWNYLRGREHLRIGNREVGENTIARVLSIIFLSMFFIIIGFFCLLLSEPAKNPVHLLFECVSAYSTVGLSLADTSSFSNTGKIIDMGLMFIGRVGPLTLLTGLLTSYSKSYARYPGIEIAIN